MVIYMNNKEEQIIFGMIKMDLYILVTMVMFQQILSVEKWLNIMAQRQPIVKTTIGFLKKTIFWTISSYLSNQKEVFIVYSDAILNGVTFNDGFVFSTLYLSPNIKINSGNGNVSNPYVLSI